MARFCILGVFLGEVGSRANLFPLPLGENIVRRLYPLETLLRFEITLVSIRVKSLGEASIGLFYLIFCSIVGEAEDLIGIFSVILHSFVLVVCSRR